MSKFPGNGRPFPQRTAAAPPQTGLTLLDLGGGLYVSPMIGQMLVAMEVKPKGHITGTGPTGNINAGDVEIDLILISGKSLNLSVDQSDKFLTVLGIRQPLVEVAPAGSI
jgi:hypothetical protein